MTAGPMPGQAIKGPAASTSSAGCCGPSAWSASRLPGLRPRPPSAGSMMPSRRWPGSGRGRGHRRRPVAGRPPPAAKRNDGEAPTRAGVSRETV